MDPVPSKHWTWSQQAQQDEKESSLVKEILSDDEKLLKSWEEAEKASKEKASAPSTSNQQSSLEEGSGSVSKEFDLQEPGKEEGEELAVKEALFTKLNTKDKALMKALSEARDLCYQQDNLSVQYVCGVIMNISSTPTAAQIHDRKLFKLGPPGNCVMDNIHSHWESYLYDFGALAYSLFPIPPQGGVGWVVHLGIFEETWTHICQLLWKEGQQAFIDSGGRPNHHWDRGWLFPQQAPQSCLYQVEVGLFWYQGVREKESCPSGHLPLLWSAISKCSLWLLPHPKAPWAHICMWSLYGVS